MKVNKILSVLIVAILSVALSGCAFNDIVRPDLYEDIDGNNNVLLLNSVMHEEETENEEIDDAYSIESAKKVNQYSANDFTEENTAEIKDNDNSYLENKTVEIQEDKDKNKKEEIKEEPIIAVPVFLGTEDEKIMFNLVNEERIKNGADELVWSNALYDVAKIRSEEASIIWSHTRPNGLKLSSLFTGEELSKCTICGENLASGFADTNKAMKGLLNSEGHKANILDKKYTKIAISFFVDSNGCIYIAQIFSN